VVIRPHPISVKRRLGGRLTNTVKERGSDLVEVEPDGTQLRKTLPRRRVSRDLPTSG
jgi:hypothetical protein